MAGQRLQHAERERRRPDAAAGQRDAGEVVGRITAQIGQGGGAVVG